MLIEGNGILITSVQDWFDSAPPKGGPDHWVSGRVVRDGLEAMALSFQPRAIARAVVRAASTELALLPRELQLVEGACVEFVRSRSLRS